MITKRKLQAKIDRLATLAADRQNTIEAYSVQLTDVMAEVVRTQKKLTKAEAVAREQTKADILYNALQLAGVIPTDKPEEHHRTTANRLYAQYQQQGMQQMAQSPYSTNGISALFGGGRWL